MEELTKAQIYFLNNSCLGEWRHTEDGIIVNDSVDCSMVYNLRKIPVKFYYVDGYFTCSYNFLENLEGCPKHVSDNFYCNYNKLTSLEGIGEVEGRIFCCNNKIDYRKEKELRPEIYKKIHDLSTLERMLVEF